MQKNKILAVYPDLCDHSYITEAFTNAYNDVICVSGVIEAVKFLMEPAFCMVIIDSKLTIGEGAGVATTLKAVCDVPILIVNAVVYKKNQEHTEKHVYHGHHHLTVVHTEPLKDLNYHHILHFSELIIDPNRREVMVDGKTLNLTKIEFDILYFLARHKGRVMSRDQIYANVWTHDSSFDIDELVKAHIKRLRKKFVSSNRAYIHNVRGIGYKFSD